MEIEYLDEHYDVIVSPVRRHGGILGLLPGMDQFGYGEKITTDKMVVIGSRKYRMYVTQYSNAGSCWIVREGKKIFLRG